MPSEPMESDDEPLETAAELERAGILHKSCAYKLVKLGILPHYRVGPKRTGLRFRRSEVLAALRQPTRSEGQ